MKLKLYSSRAGSDIPNLVSVQHPSLNVLPTVVVCPLKSGETITEVRTTLRWKAEIFTVLCDLIRPINRQALIEIGEVDAATSRIIMQKVLTLFALPDD